MHSLRVVIASVLCSAGCLASLAGCATEEVVHRVVQPTDPEGAAIETIDPTLLGEFCSGLSNEPGVVLAFGSMKDCEAAAGVCVADGRRTVSAGGGERIDSYCTASCEAAACPEAWECVDNAVAEGSGPKRVCVKQAPICGDGIKQLDEVCEDGNVEAKDGCSADCTKKLPAAINVKSFRAFLRGDDGKEKGVMSKAFYITKFPVLEDATDFDGLGDIGKVTPGQVEVGVGVMYTANPTNPFGFRLLARLPRTAGKLASLDGVEGGITPNLHRAGPGSEAEVLSVGKDGRSYEARVHFEGTNDYGAVEVVDTTFVVTLP